MKSPVPKRSGDLRLLILAAATASFLAACGAERRYQVLSTLMDGVPTPQQRAAQKAGQNCQCPTELPKQSSLPSDEQVPGAAAPEDPTLAAVLAPPPRPAIEKVQIWEEVLKLLPLDSVGGPDWVKALQDGVIAPRTRLKSATAPEAPFDLNTLVAATITDDKPPFDLNVEIVPKDRAFYKVMFPHSSHTQWLNCSSCHTGIVAQRGSGMKAILRGEYCGKCHGKVSFAPMTSCARCHVGLTPDSLESIEEELAKAGPDLQVPMGAEAVASGKALYGEACAVCHGDAGGGDGPLADSLVPRPRNFTVGKFKFRSTNSSSIPTNYDLFRTITRGIPGTSMPSYSFLSLTERLSIVAYIKTFSEKFEKQKPSQPIQIPEPPPRTPELLEMGKQLYKEADCHKCHGDEGRGDGPSAGDLKDDWGQPIRPFDFTSGRPKSGGALKDYYRDVMTGLQGTPMRDYYQDVMTGLQGTPMPEFGDVFEPEQAWAVVYYVYSLGDVKRGLPPAVRGDIDFQRGLEHSGASVEAAEIGPARFPHWFHRMRVRCAVCHPKVFEMKAGANSVTMDKIRAGQYCGTCHPSYPDPQSLAWPVSFETCTRCHPAQQASLAPVLAPANAVEGVVPAGDSGKREGGEQPLAAP